MSTQPSHQAATDRSGMTTPLWYDAAPASIPQPVPENTHANVCVVGAGIAGLMTAYLLAHERKSVIVIDEKPVGGGETGRTSAHLASVIDDRFKSIEQKHGVYAAKLLYRSHAAGIDQIERIVQAERIECDFARLDGILFAGDGVPASELEEEFAAAERVGVDGVQMTSGKLPSNPQAPCIRFAAQARFHPLRFLTGLAGALERMGVRIYRGSRVMDLAGDGPVVAKLDSGLTVTADVGVSATNVPTPINNWVGIYTKQAAYRTYVVALECPEGAVGDALYWDMNDPYHYVRLAKFGGRSVLVVGGEDHKTGQPGEHDGAERFERLHRWARQWFPGAGAVVAQWSGQVNEPDDGVAFIGRVPTRGHNACFVITGDSGMGLTHGALGAMLITDLVLGRPNPWEKVYDPARKPWHAAGSFIKENVNAAAQLVDYATTGSDMNDIPACSGAVVRSGLSLLAVYRQPSGELHACSAICPHLKCVVRWNQTEQSWDCPCHGSRFDATGKLITGPAIDDLAKHELPDQSK